MCVPAGAQLPDLPLSGPVPTGQRGIVTAEDGGQNAAYEVTPDRRSGTGILVLPDIRGLSPFYEHLACAMAAESRHALVIDYYGRTAGVEPRPEDWDTWDDDLDATSPAQITLDVRAGLARLRDLGAERTFVLGFCFGGGMVFRHVDQDLGVSGMMAVYGMAREWEQYPRHTATSLEPRPQWWRSSVARIDRFREKRLAP